MGKLEDKITRAAHIKRHTVGTSNEISFSVLDAAKQALDSEDAGEEKRGPLFGRITPSRFRAAQEADRDSTRRAACICPRATSFRGRGQPPALA
ncbi:MAG: hypothetical protein ACLSVD_09775 [Eggerthellaceae bacterium]